MMPSFWYLGSPYSRYMDGLEAAFNLAVDALWLLMQHKVPTFSPIAHSHQLAIRHNLDPRDLTIWLPQVFPMIDAAQGIVILRAPGWEQSKGLAAEYAQFQGMGKPIIYMDPGLVPVEFQSYSFVLPTTLDI